ncbi:hypothetical protein ScPMuIL_007029 [Solemya velum]
MRLLKPSWVHHDGKAIFSVDIHPDDSRFATGGQGEDAGKIMIWNMAPVRDEKDEKDDSVPKILCQMDNHLACVNCVRWSHNGKCLASGGDDKMAMIWQISRNAGVSTVFGSGRKNLEQWRPVTTLRGHSGDVLDLAWSPEDVWLATCSVDNTIIVWNAEKFPEQIAVLKGHCGLVKGVTWDPVGKYLASQADDKSVRIWRTLDWQMESSITEPFNECGGTTHVLRLNWSPDGHYIVSAHAMNNSGPTAQIIEREGWKATLDFVGHRKAITVVRFNPKILSKKLKKGAEKPQQYTCCAIGSRDRSISIWLTALKRPLVVTHDLFTNSILDITWGTTGMELMTCSLDGTVAFLDFSPEEIGLPLSQEDVNRLLENVYGKCITANKSSSNNTQIIESAAMLTLQQQQQQKQQQQQQERLIADMEASNTSSSLLSNRHMPTDKQIETKTPDGRRRITPIFLAPQRDKSQMFMSGQEAPIPFSSKNIQFTSSKESSKIVIEKQDRVTHPGFSSPSSRSGVSNSMSSPPQGSTKTTGSVGDMSKIETPSGDKKSTGDSKSPSMEKVEAPITSLPQPMAALETKSQEIKDKPEKVDKPQEKSETQEKLKSDTSTPERPEKIKEKTKSRLSLPMKRKHDGHGGKVGRPRKIDKDRSLLATPVAPTPVVNEREPVRHVQPISEIQIPVPASQKTFSKQIAGRPGDTEDSFTISVENDVQSGAVTLHKLKCVHRGVDLWDHIVSSKVSIVAGSSHIFCVACEDGTLSVFSAKGRKLFPSLVLCSRISILEVTGYHVMAITQKGNIFVWNMQTKQAVIQNESLSGILSANTKLEKCSLTNAGIPVLSLSTHKSYIFSMDLACWVLVHQKGSAVRNCSDHQSCTPSNQSRLSGPLTSLLSREERSSFSANRVFQTSPHIRQVSTLSNLENQVASSLMMKSPTEYKFWLITYIRYLVQEGFESRLREVCEEFLGPVYKTKNTQWQDNILGLQKRDLLQEILPFLGTNLKLQRLYTEYQEQLECLQT